MRLSFKIPGQVSAALAPMANQFVLSAMVHALTLKGRFDVLVETVCTKLMCLLEVTHKAFLNIGKNARADCLKCIFLSLCIPVFEMHNFLFKFVYFRRQRRFFGLQGEGHAICCEKLGVYLADCGDNLVVIAKAVRRLKKGR